MGDDTDPATIGAVLLYFEQTKRYTDEVFELCYEECKALREEIRLLRERCEQLETMAHTRLAEAGERG